MTSIGFKNIADLGCDSYDCSLGSLEQEKADSLKVNNFLMEDLLNFRDGD